VEVVYPQRAKQGYSTIRQIRGENQYRDNPAYIEIKGKLRAETTPLEVAGDEIDMSKHSSVI